MDSAAKWSRRGDVLIRYISLLLALCMLLYGTYSLYDNYSINKSAFASERLLQYKPTDDHKETLEGLININSDVIAWLTVDKTHIDYPIVKCKNNLEYINKNVYGNFQLSGAIFLNSLNKPDFSDPYNVVFGHHMENGAMFGDITEFTDKSYFNSHKTGTLFLKNKTKYNIQFFACIQCDAANVIIYNTTKGSINQRLNYIKKHSIQYQNININNNDKVIALSTCQDAVTNGRILLFGKMIR